MYKTQLNFNHVNSYEALYSKGSNSNQDFSGISWGIGVGSSYLDKENITNAVVVGSQTRILEKNRRSASVILETHYLLPVRRNRPKVLSEATNGTLTALNTLLETSATDTVKIKNCIEVLNDQMKDRQYFTSLASGSINVLHKKLMMKYNSEYSDSVKALTKNLRKLRYEPKPRGATYGVGPFCCVKMGGDTLIDGFGIGLMIGIKSDDNSRILNIGIAKGFQTNVKRISDSFDSTKESDLAKMFTNQDVDAWTIVVSTKLW